MGCGESKHAVATTESLSTRKGLSSSSSRKDENIATENDTKLSNHLPVDHKENVVSNDENVPKKGETKEPVDTNNKDSNIITAYSSGSSSILKEQEEEKGHKEAKVAKSFVVHEDNKVTEIEVGHERVLSRDSQSEFLSINEAKSEYQSSPRVSIHEEPVLEEADKPDDPQENQGKPNQSIQEEKEKTIESVKLDNKNQAVEEVKDHIASTEVQTTPKAEEKNVIVAMDTGADIAKD